MRLIRTIRGVATGAVARALLAGGAVALPLAPVMAKDAAPAASGPHPSAEFVTAATPLKKTLVAVEPLRQKYLAAPADGRAAAQAALKDALVAADAVGQIQAAEAGIKTPDDRYIAGEWCKVVGQALRDAKLLQHCLQNVVDSGVAPADEAGSAAARLGALAYQNEDYATAVKVLPPVVAANYPGDDAATVLALSYYNLKQHDAALAAMQTAYDARKAAGGTVPESWLILANKIAYGGQAAAAPASEWALRLAGAYPTPANFLLSVQWLRAYNNYEGGEALDASRLLKRTGALAGSDKGVADEYREYVHAIDFHRYPQELLDVIKAGMAAGALSATSPNIVELRALSEKGVAADRVSLPAFVKDAHAPGASVKTVTAAADTLLSYGDAAQAIELYQAALGKAGVDANLVNTRLGIAQVDTGDYAGAAASFARVDGTRKPLARLWAIYARTKAGAR